MALELPRRQFLGLTAGAAVFPAAPRIARAQTYPSRPVRIVVGFAAGASSDIVARLIAQYLSERFGQQFIVENRPGAGTNIATEAVIRAAADGYSLLWVTQTNVINATLYSKLNFNFIQDIVPVASILRLAGVMEVNPAFPAKTVPEFIAYAKANPGKINLGTAGNGSAQHLYGEMFKMMAGVDMVYVPNRVQPVNDLLGGQVQVVFGPLPSSIEFIRAGKLRALAVTTAKRQEVLPDVPTVAEFVPGYEASGWFGVGAPAKTPDQIIDALHKELNAALADPGIRTRLGEFGTEPTPMTRAEFSTFMGDETEKWAKVIHTANIASE
jgi:tripartite-type tricarboxylate transporter receptor subunit TctC